MRLIAFLDSFAVATRVRPEKLHACAAPFPSALPASFASFCCRSGAFLAAAGN
jgi:hypothetical protein